MEPRDPERIGLGLDPGEGPTVDLDGIDQGRPGEADRTLVLVWADSLAKAKGADRLEVAKTVAATTTTV